MAGTPSQRAAQPPVFLAAGSGGVDELQAALDDTAVCWALLRIGLGSGAFRRHKLLFLHFNADGCPAVARGRLNARTAAVQSFLRGCADKEGFHASLELTQAADVTREEIWSRIHRCFVSDDLGEVSVQWSWQENDRQSCCGPRLLDNGDAEVGTGRGRRIPGHQSIATFNGGRDALQAVGEACGAWNWCLIGADVKNLSLEGGGSGSVDELRNFLSSREDSVFFGVLRLGFGEGRLRRTKYVFLQVTGPKASPVQRGRLVASRPRAEQVLKQFAHCCTGIAVSSAADLTLESLVDRVRRASVVDDDILDGDKNTRRTLTVEAFREALLEERQIAEAKEDPVLHKKPSRSWDLTVNESVGLVHAPDGPIDWALYGPQPGWNLARGLSRQSTMEFREKVHTSVTHADAENDQYPVAASAA